MMDDDSDEIPPVIEVSPDVLMQERRGLNPPRILDCREPYEVRQVRIPGPVVYIPMNEIPDRLTEIDRQADWVVVCAHGQRSYAVAEFLAENGYQVRSLRGGVFGWYFQRGEVETG
jgi:rhodanese-related sulfurtransferase